MANAINHPLLLPRLLHLDLPVCKVSHQGELGSPPFTGSRLQKLSLRSWVEVDGEDEFLSGLLPLPPTLTQLEVQGSHAHQWDWARMAEIVSSLTQLQQLRLFDEWSEGCTTWSGYMALLPALAHLPSLQTLEMDDAAVGQEELDAFLALTQITSLKFSEFYGLTSSRASTPCSWRQLEVHRMDWVTAAFLPLHSLTHPLHLDQLVGNMMEDFALGNMMEAFGLGNMMEDIEEPSIELLAAAELNLCESNKAGLVLDDCMFLSKATLDLLTEQYLTHSRHTAQQPTHPSVASSSSYTGPSTSLASSSSPEGHITPGVQGSSSGVGGQQGVLAAGGQVLMQRLSHCVKAVYIRVPGPGEKHMSQANQQALAVLFPTAYIGFSWPWWIPA
ncbi:hypothetical protein QJQ45_010681 [Haematococcus lacustris]|nr:hypothetical protein QJQ45_010681 [Haematococcus lacustris]